MTVKVPAGRRWWSNYASLVASGACTYKVELLDDQTPGQGIYDASVFGYAVVEDNDSGSNT